MPEKIRVIQYGLGPIGRAVALHIVERADLALVACVDIDPAKRDKDISEVIGLESPMNFAVVEKLKQALEQTEADIVLHTTSSHFDQFKGQIVEILNAKLNVVSTAEELSFPWTSHPREAKEIDTLAKHVNKTVLGTGVNPGFIMDSLPIYLTSICKRVDYIEVKRIINASLRRGQFQAKIGCGMTVDEFNDKVASGRMGHVGLLESIGMVFHALGKTLSRYETSIEPQVAGFEIKTDYFCVKPGQVKGLRQEACGYTDEAEFVRLSFIAALDAGGDGDTIKITGEPNLEVKLKGTNGDIATVAIAVNAIRKVEKAPPGLFTMCDLPLGAKC